MQHMPGPAVDTMFSFISHGVIIIVIILGVDSPFLHNHIVTQRAVNSKLTCVMKKCTLAQRPVKRQNMN